MAALTIKSNGLSIVALKPLTLGGGYKAIAKYNKY